LLRAAKAEGLPVTADVNINSLHLTDVDIGYFNADMRLSPPLRQGPDREALRRALADGTIDALVSDHNPVADDMKNLPFGEAEPGATGLELLLSLALRWGADLGLPLHQALAVVTQGPARVLGSRLGALEGSAGRLEEGGMADLCLFDPAVDWTVTPEQLTSQGKHTPFAYAGTGMALSGRVRCTIVAGTLAYRAADQLPSALPARA
jgi:dihydroorotase